MKVKLLSRVRLSDLMDCSLPDLSIHGIFQARVLEWVAIAFSKKVKLLRCHLIHFRLENIKKKYSVLANKDGRSILIPLL